MEASIGTEAAGFVKGVMFGEKEDISEDVMEEFQRNGTAHILAVSGLHIGMIYGVISGIWRWKKGKLYFITVSIFLCCYCIIASFSPSVIRAVFMVEMHLVSKMINRRYDLSSAAFFNSNTYGLKQSHADFQCRISNVVFSSADAFGHYDFRKKYIQRNVCSQHICADRIASVYYVYVQLRFGSCRPRKCSDHISYRDNGPFVSCCTACFCYM